MGEDSSGYYSLNSTSLSWSEFTLNEKVGFIIPTTTRTRTFSMSARRFSGVGAVQFRRRVGIGILLGWLGV